jgi:hypothetical protein
MDTKLSIEKEHLKDKKLIIDIIFNISQMAEPHYLFDLRSQIRSKLRKSNYYLLAWLT